MKNLFKKTMLFAAAAMAFVSCNNDTFGDENVQVPGFEVSVNATTSEVARSAFGDYNSTDKTYPTLWEGNEAWWIGVNDKYAEDVKTITFSNGNTAASAKFELTEAPAAVNGTYTLFAVSPASAWSSYKLADDYLRFYIARNTQTPTATSCDPASQVLFAKSEAMESADAFSVNFEHLSAYIKFSFVNVAEGGVVNSVSIASENVDLAGRYQYTPSTGKIAPYDRLEKSITLVTESHENLWVSVAPVDLSGKKLTFSITTDKGILSKEVTMPATAKLESGKVVTFNVDMAGIEYPSAEAGEEWQLVTDPANLTDGEYIIVGKSQAGNVVYLPSTTTSSAPSQKIINVPGLDMTSTASFTTTLIPEDARFTFSGSASAMTITNANGNYLYLYNNNNGLRIGTTEGSWTIATNPNNSNALTFSMTATKTRYISVYKNQDWRSYEFIKPDAHDSNGASGSVFLYKKVAGGSEGGETPEEPATPVLTVNPTTLSFEAATASKTVTCTIENEVSGVNVTATESVDWLTTSVSGKTVTITASENTTTEVRNANVIIEYQGAESKTIAVSQAAAEATEPEQPGGGDEPVVVLSEQFDNNSASDSSNAITTSTFPNFSGATDKAYKGKYGSLKLGSKSAVGYITSKSLDLSSAFTVQIDACKYGSDTGNIVVTCGSQSQTIKNSELGAAGSFKTFTLTFSAATAASTVKIATSSKRAYIDNVVITRN